MMNNKPNSAPKAPLPAAIDLLSLNAYGSLSFPLAAAFITLQVIIPTFYAESTGLSLTQIGLVLLMARLWDMFTDPLVGMLSDQTPQALGRRKIWIVAAAPLIAITTWNLFNPPDTAGWGYLLIWTFLIYVAGTMAIVPMNAWGAELSPRYNQRSRVSGIRAAYGLTGTLAALLLAALTGSRGTSELQQPLEMISWLVIATLVITVPIAALKVVDRSQINLPDSSMRSAWQLISEPSPFRRLIFSFLLNNIGNAIPATLFLLYVSYVLKEPQQAGALLFVYFIFAAISVPLWLTISRRYGKHQSWIVAIVLACSFFVFTPLLSAGDINWFYLIVAVTGLAAGADLILPVAMKGDLIEWDYHKNSLRRPGLFFAIWGTTTKLSFALAIGIAFPALQLAGFSTGANELVEGAAGSLGGTDDSNGLTALAIMYGAPCILFKLTAAWLMRNYPITEAEHQRISRQILARETPSETA